MDLPPLVWDAHLVPLLSLSEVMSISTLNRSFHKLMHHAVTLYHPVDINAPVDELEAITDAWTNLKAITYKPFIRSDEPYNNESIYHLPHRQQHDNIDEPEGEMDILDINPRMEHVIAQSVPAIPSKDKLSGSVGKLMHRLHSLDLSGTHRLELSPGTDDRYCFYSTPAVTASRLTYEHNATVDLSYCHAVSDISPLQHATAVFLNMCKSI
ncbi:hypothetical protein DYB28_004556, partial [Aphanomyces astaci]